jgi:tRNA pseudouridine55 synthase
MMSDGILLIDKGFGLTSSEAVQTAKKLTGSRKAGHAGTLDPLATGLLIVTLGKATKISAYLGNGRKRYRAKIKFGETRDTFDRLGKLIDRRKLDFTQLDLHSALKKFEGEIEQLIPPHSAAHVNGKRMYELARKGENLPVKKKVVRIYELNVPEYQAPFLQIDIVCESGTYIRSIAHQLGEMLGCGALLHSLARTESGRFKLKDAITLVQLEAVIKMELFDDYMIPLDDALTIPSIVIESHNSEDVRQGRTILERDVTLGDMQFSEGDSIIIKDNLGSLLAIGKALISSRELKSSPSGTSKVFEYKRVI